MPLSGRGFSERGSGTKEPSGTAVPPGTAEPQLRKSVRSTTIFRALRRTYRSPPGTAEPQLRKSVRSTPIAKAFQPPPPKSRHLRATRNTHSFRRTVQCPNTIILPRQRLTRHHQLIRNQKERAGIAAGIFRTWMIRVFFNPLHSDLLIRCRGMYMNCSKRSCTQFPFRDGTLSAGGRLSNGLMPEQVAAR